MNWPTAFVVGCALLAGGVLFSGTSGAQLGGGDVSVVALDAVRAIHVNGDKARACFAFNLGTYQCSEWK